MRRAGWEVVLALVLVATAACAYLATTPQYLASGGVLLPSGMVRVQYVERDPRAALAQVENFVRAHPNALFADPPLVTVSHALAWPVPLLVLAAIMVLAFLRRRVPPGLRSERELVAVLGAPLLAARPLAPRHLCEQLMQCWFGRGRALLTVVSAQAGDGCSTVAAQLARAFAAAGEPTLLVDADLRSPALHRAFGLPNRAGLADFLAGRKASLAHAAENLAVLVAGRAGEDPLELLSRGRLQHLLAAAAKRYRVVIVDTPAAERGPDLQMFAALGGGALVVTRHPARAGALQKLKALLDPCRARVVGTVLNPA